MCYVEWYENEARAADCCVERARIFERPSRRGDPDVSGVERGPRGWNRIDGLILNVMILM